MRSENDDRSGGPSRIEPLTPADPPAIGPYRLLGRLGAGGMGRVYLARSEGGRTVAVKVVHEEHTSDTQFRARFRREVEAARRVGADFTAPVLDADPGADRPWVATGFVPGLSLEQVVREYGPLPTSSVHALADGLLRALRGIHDAGIVHRDLKPSNVMLTVTGPRVIDFGIARAVRTSIESLLTSTGMAVGSPGFMAPEQILAEETGPRADVFALGCVLTYAATGRLAFGHGASNQHALMYRIVEAEPDLALVKDDALRELITRCLTKNVDERPDVAALLADPARPRPSGGRGASLPAELVTQLAQQAALLLDVEAEPAPEEAVREPEAETPEAELEPEPEPEKQPTAEAQPEAQPEAQAQPATVSPPGTLTPPDRPRRRTWIVAAVVTAVLLTGSTVYFIERDRGTQGARDPGNGASRDPGDAPGSPSPSKSGDGKKGDKGEDKGKGDGAKGGSAAGGEGESAGSGDGTGAGDDSDTGSDTDAKPPAGSGSSSSSGGSGSGSGSGDAPSGGVPSSFVGTWKTSNAYGAPARIEIKQVSPGRQAVSFFRMSPSGGGKVDCVSVARLTSVENGGTRLNLDAATVDTARSTGYGCTAEKPSYIDSGSSSRIDWFSSKAHTDDTFAEPYTRA